MDGVTQLRQKKEARNSRRAGTATTRIEVSSAIPGPLASGEIRSAARGIEKEPQCIAQDDLRAVFRIQYDFWK
jgi:hypothetical protein